MVNQSSFAIRSYRGVYSTWFYKRGKKARVMVKAKAAYIVERAKQQNKLYNEWAIVKSQW